jgi:hypothetical protein
MSGFVLTGILLTAATVGVQGFLARRRSPLLLPMLVLDLAVFGLAAIAVMRPALFEAWAQEDQWIEWGTFASFLIAAGLNARAALHSTETDRVTRISSRVWLLALAGFCAFVALEEISWGQRLFGLQPPNWFLEENFQQELNLHNVLKDKSLGALALDSRYLVALIAGAFGLLGPVLARIPGLTRLRIFPITRLAPSWTLSPLFALVVLVSIVYPVSLGGEATELVLGLLFVVDAGLRPASGRWSRESTVLAALLASVALGILLAPLTDRLLYGDDTQGVALATEELRALAAGIQRTSQPALWTRRRIHKRLFTAERDGYLDLSSFSEWRARQQSATDAKTSDRLHYLLDPWKNAYWIHARRDEPRALLYSFGPNRRRDTDLDSPPSPDQPLAGDDVGIWTAPPP